MPEPPLAPKYIILKRYRPDLGRVRPREASEPPDEMWIPTGLTDPEAIGDNIGDFLVLEPQGKPDKNGVPNGGYPKSKIISTVLKAKARAPSVETKTVTKLEEM